MILRSSPVSTVLLVRPGATEFDDQGRIKGSLDMPMSQRGREQVTSLTEQLAQFRVKTIYSAPCESARETAQRLAHGRDDVRIKVVDAFRNIDHGLWHGKLIDELRRNHPRSIAEAKNRPPTSVHPVGNRFGMPRLACSRPSARSSARVATTCLPL